MPLEIAYRPLLPPAVVWENPVVRGEKPASYIPIGYPTPPSPGEADFRFEPPTVPAVIDDPGRIVFSRWHHNGQAGANQLFLIPFEVLSNIHRRPSLQIHREPDPCISQA